MYVLAGATLASLVVLPGASRAHPAAMLATAAVAIAWGASSLLLIDWGKAPRWLIHFSALLAFVTTAVTVASSGGATSPAWLYLLFIAVAVAYFFRRPIAIAYIGGCVAIHALLLLHDPRALHVAFLGRLLIATAACVGMGGAISAGKSLMWELRARAEQLADEQGSLRRVPPPWWGESRPSASTSSSPRRRPRCWGVALPASSGWTARTRRR